jgi:hypothetical protein
MSVGLPAGIRALLIAKSQGRSDNVARLARRGFGKTYAALKAKDFRGFPWECVESPGPIRSGGSSGGSAAGWPGPEAG